MRTCLIPIIILQSLVNAHLHAQEADQINSIGADTIRTAAPLIEDISTGWADEAVTIGYVTAPSVVTLMFVSALINEWNAGYVGIPASAMILVAPPLIYAGGRSVDISKELINSRAKLGWTLYALSIIPASMAMYGFTTEWGATLPLTIASGLLGTGSIIAMTTYAFSRAETARKMESDRTSSLQLGISPLPGGAIATVVLNF
jgi:hypothetical protein